MSDRRCVTHSLLGAVNMTANLPGELTKGHLDELAAENELHDLQLSDPCLVRETAIFRPFVSDQQ